MDRALSVFGGLLIFCILQGTLFNLLILNEYKTDCLKDNGVYTEIHGPATLAFTSCTYTKLK